MLRTQPDEELEGTFEGTFEADQPWKSARLSSEKREKFFHLFYSQGQAFSGPEPPKRGPSPKKIVVVGGTTLGTILMAVLIVLIARDGGGSTPVATTGPTSEPAAAPQASVAPPTEEEEAAPSPDPTDGADDVVADPLAGVPGATVEAVLVGRTPEGADQVQVILAGDGRGVADDPAAETYGVGVNVSDEEDLSSSSTGSSSTRPPTSRRRSTPTETPSPTQPPRPSSSKEASSWSSSPRLPGRRNRRSGGLDHHRRHRVPQRGIFRGRTRERATCAGSR